MNKKNYIKPEILADEAEVVEMLCTSVEVNLTESVEASDIDARDDSGDFFGW